MKVLLLLSLVTLACSAKLYINRPVYILEILRERTLADDFRELKALIPEKKLEDLVRRYLVSDAEFQSIIRYLGSEDAFRAIETIGAQPEIRQLNTWLQQQLQTPPRDGIFDDDSSEELYQLLNRTPTGRDERRGWKGFMMDFLAIYPRQEIRNLIRDKVAANGIFAEFWSKLVALRPVYERILKLPEVRKVIDRLRQLGVDTMQLDRLIREDFGWKIGGIQQIGGNGIGKLPARRPEGAASGGAAGGAGTGGGAGGAGSGTGTGTGAGAGSGPYKPIA